MTVTGQEITDYVERVRAALADLPPEVRDELTEDLPEHLAEVAAEADGSLVARLGEPEAYAVELRAAAGAGHPTGGLRGLDQRIGAAAGRLRARLSGVDTGLGPILGYASASEFLRLLRPAWWVLRGYLAALLISAVLGAGLTVVPRPFLSEFAGVLLLAVTVLASIWLGRNSGGLRRGSRRLIQVGAFVLVVFGVVLVTNLDERSRWGDYGYDPTSVQNPYDQVQDVFVYDSEGRLVENARLFDQNGTPIRLGWPSCNDPALPDVDPSRHGYPYCPQQAPFRPLSPAAVPPAPAATGTVPAAPTATGTVPAPTTGTPAPADPVPTTAPPAPPAPEPTR